MIAGAPNVGKSSLMNALAGYTRSVVAPTPGTTRDVVTTRLAIDGWPIEMTDTAGMRPTSSDLEQQGIDRAHDAVRDADLRIWLLDGSAEPIFPDDGELGISSSTRSTCPRRGIGKRCPTALRVSAQTQAGLAELVRNGSRDTLVPEAADAGRGGAVFAEQSRMGAGAGVSRDTLRKRKTGAPLASWNSLL